MKTKTRLIMAFCMLACLKSFSQTTTDFTSTIIAKKGKNRNQMLMASQSYGTSYALYGDFFLEEQADGKMKFKILKIEIKNYRTNLFLGIDSVKINDKNKDSVVSSIDVYVKADMKRGDRTKDVITLKKPGPKEYFLKKGEKIEINRYIMPLNYQPITQEQFNDTTFIPANNGSKFRNKLGFYQIFPWDNQQKIFDSEFFFMDGLLDVRRKADYDRNNNTRPPSFKSPGFRCKSGVVIVM